jgi:iron complex outermembrane receptor protein
MKFTRDYRERIRVRSKIATPRHFPTALSILVLASLVASQAVLATDLGKVVLFNIEAQALEKALLQFGAQAHVQVSIAMDSAIRRLNVPDLKGNYTGRQALTILLKGTNLTFGIKGDIVEVSSESGPANQSHDPTSANGTDSSRWIEASNGPGNNEKTQPRPRALQEVVITGSRLPTTFEYGAQEVQIYGQAQIEESGQTSVADFLSTLPSVSVTLPILTANGTTVQLRGLPVGTTLVLLNGRRLQSSGTTGGEYFDLSEIPLAAVQKIEVDENGASAVYGSDAIAGIVNIILKNNFDGFAADATYGWAKNVKNLRSSLALGREWRRGGLSVIGSYEANGELLNSDRLLSASNDYTSYGGPDQNFPACWPGNVFSVNGGPLPGGPPGNEATYAAVSGQTVSGKPAVTQFNYGALNNCSLIAGTSILPETRRAAAVIQGHFDVGRKVTLFTEVMYTHLERTIGDGYESLFGTPGFQEYTVSTTNPFNPFGTTVGVAGQVREAPIVNTQATDFFRPLVGAKGSMADSWHWEMSLWQSSDWTRVLQNNAFQNSGAIQAALDSSNPATALNPFVAGPIGSQQLLESLFYSQEQKDMGRDQSAEGWLRGSVMRLPAGPLRLVVGGDYVRSALYLNTSSAGASDISSYQRRYEAAFGELSVPLISSWTSDSASLLDLTVSGRHDHYSDFGGATTYQLGAEFRPFKGLLVRGNYGTAFSAPSLVDLYSPQLVTPNALVTDPLTGGTYPVNEVYGGNPNLRSLAGRSHTLGLVYASPEIPGLLLAATQWAVVENNVIQPVSAQVVVDNPLDFPGRVVRNSAGQIVEVNTTEANFGSFDVGGVDYTLAYTRQLWFGVSSIRLEVAQTYHYRQALVPGAQPVESVSQAEDDGDWAPRWKGTVGLNWSQGSLGIHVDGRYTGSYMDYDSTEMIGNFWLADANARWSLGEWLGSHARYLRGGYIEAGGTNLLNRAPQFSNYLDDLIGYDAAQMSIVGRYVYVTVGDNW